MKTPPAPIRVIDLFAGPGGLGEGFSRYRPEGDTRAFKIRLSIEKEPSARATLRLRSFFRQFDSEEAVPDDYYEYVRRRRITTWEKLAEEWPEEAAAAEREAWQAELGKEDHRLVRERIRKALGPSKDNWVLIGGPPCQAYSLVGRSRLKAEHRKQAKGNAEFDYVAEFDKDHRHFLYRQYLRIIADHRPAVFVMENVPGLLSSQIAGEPIIKKIIRDLAEPIEALKPDERPEDERPLEYRLCGLSARKGQRSVRDGDPESLDLRSFIVRAEEHGVAQARHRVLIIGVRSDLEGFPDSLEPDPDSVTVKTAVSDLPQLRSRLSRRLDTPHTWADVLLSMKDQPWFSGIDPRVRTQIKNALRRIKKLAADDEPPFFSMAPPDEPAQESELLTWCRDSRLECTLNHEARSHMNEDLWRYIFAAAYAKVHAVAPRIASFPEPLRPLHGSAAEAAKLKSGMFADRFRVQLEDKPSSTVVSHISRDGHYYIHYDPVQCRSLTVREAARLQSFPDNYYFEGNRTSQYIQVGNAVPPLLASKVAETIYQFLRRQERISNETEPIFKEAEPEAVTVM